MAACYDCKLPYDDPGFADVVVPDDVWLKISPTGHHGGLLCPTCMVRAAARAGVSVVAVFTSGPFACDEIPRLRTALLEIATLGRPEHHLEPKRIAATALNGSR